MPIPGLYTNDYPPEYKAYDSQYQGAKEAIGFKLWDTQTYVSGTTTSLPQWFNIRATPDLGNMETAFALPAPKAFLIRAVRSYVKQRPFASDRATAGNPQPGAFDNVVQLGNTGVFTFTIGHKLYMQEPLYALLAGAGPYGFISAEGATGDPGGIVDYGQMGPPDPRSVHTLAKPIFLSPQINFSAVVTWPVALTLAGSENVDLTITLEGDLIRPVQ